jgi:hypothetical protein
MPSILKNDFVVNAGLVVEGTSVVSTNTNNTGSAHIYSGLLIDKNIIVRSTASFLGSLTVDKSSSVGGSLTVGGNITAANVYATVSTATNLTGGAAQSIPVQSSTGTTTFIPIGLPFQFLTVDVFGVAGWTNFTAVSVGVANTSTNLGFGTAGQIPYQLSSGVTRFVGPGSTGQVLISNGGTIAPQFTNNLTNLGSVNANNLTITNFASISTASIGILTATDLTVVNSLYVGSSTYIAGDLYVDGTQFTVNRDVISSGDKILALSTGSVANRSFADGSGFLIGSTVTNSAWASLTYNYTNNRWQSNIALAINTATQSDGTMTGALVIGGGAGLGGNLHVGGTAKIYSNADSTTTASGALQVVGGVGIGGNLNVGGALTINGIIPQISSNQGTFEYITVTGTNVGLVVNNGASISNTLTVNTIIVSSTLSSLTTTASNSLYVKGGLGVDGIINARDIYSNGYKVSLQASSVSSITGGTDTVVNTATGAVTIWNNSTLQTITNRGATTTNAISVTSTATSLSTATGALTISGGVGIGDNLNVGQTAIIGAALSNYLQIAGGSPSNSNSPTVSAQGTASNINLNLNSKGSTGSVFIDAAKLNFISINGTGSSGSPNIAAIGTDTTINVLVTPKGTTGSVVINSLTGSNSSTTGALTVLGGVGIIGNLNVGGTISVSQSLTSPKFSGVLVGVASTATTVSVSATATNNIFYPAFVNQNSQTLTNYSLFTTATFSVNPAIGVSIINITASTGTASGALIVAGGVGVNGNVFVGGNVITSGITSPAGTNQNILIDPDGVGDVYFSTATQVYIYDTEISTSTTTGALQVSGGVGIGGNLYVGGNIVTLINQYVVFGGNTGTRITRDGGLNGLDLQTAAVSRLFIADTDGAVTIRSTTGSTSTNSGALQVAGGVGIGGSLYVNNTATFGSIGGIVNVVSTAASTSSTTGALRVSGGVGISGALNVANISYIAGSQIITSATISSFINASGVNSITAGTDTAISTSSGIVVIWNTGTLQSITNRGVTTTNAISITSTASSTSTTTGALTVTGGVGIGGSLYVANTSYIAGSQIITSDNISNFGVKSITAGTDTAISTSSGIVVIWNTTTFQSLTNRGATTTNAISITSTADSTNTATGALTVVGGVGVGGSLFVGGNITATNYYVTSGSLVFSGNISSPAWTTSGIRHVSIPATLTDTSSVGTVANAYTNNFGGNTIAASNIVTFTNYSTMFVNAPVAGTNVTITNSYSVITAGGILIASTAASTSTATGALQVAGGVSIVKDLYVGGVVTGGGAKISGSITGTTASFYGDAIGNAALYAGIPNGFALFPQTMIQASGNNNSYMELNVQNINAGAQASTDVVASADNVTTSTSFIDMGITSSGWDGTQPYSLGKTLGPLDGYLLVAPGNTVGRGNLVIGTINTATSIKFVVAATNAQSSNTVVTTASVAVVINSANTTAASTSTATLVVYGGVGIGNNLYVGGVVTATSMYVGTSPVLTVASIGQYGVGSLNGLTGTVTIVAGTDTAISNSGTSITVSNTSTLQSVTARGARTDQVVYFDNTATSFSTTSGSVVVKGGMAVAGNMYVGGTITANILAIQYTTITTTLVTTDDVISTYNTTASTGTTSGALIVGGGAGFGGNVYIGATSYIANSQIITTATLAGYFIAGTDTAISSSSGVITIWNTSTLQSVTNRGATTNNAVSINNTASSTGTASGALQVLGGVGIGGSLYVATAGYISGSQIITTATIGNFGVSSVVAGTDTAISSSTGVVTIWSTSTLQTVTGRGAATNNAISITNATSSISTTTGALQVRGGVGIGGNINVGGTITGSTSSGLILRTNDISTSTEIATINITAGAINSAGTTPAGSINLTGGAGTGNNNAGGSVNITGGVGSTSASGSVNITGGAISGSGIGDFAGDVNISGGDGSSGNNAGSVYIGSKTMKPGGGVFIATGGNALVPGKSAQLYLNGQDGTIAASGNQITLVSTATTGTINNMSIGASTAATGRFTTASITSNVVSTSTTTGALTVRGGVGIQGALYVNALYVDADSYMGGSQIVTTASLSNVVVTSIIAGTDTAISSSTGVVTIWDTSTLQTVTGRGSVTSNAISITSTAASTGTATGALTVAGGVGIGGIVYIGIQTTGTVNAMVYGSALLATINATTSTSIQTIVDSFSTSTYRSAKYFCQITSGTSYVHISEISVFHANGVSYINEYGISTNNGILGVYDANISNGNLNILLTPISSAAIVLKMSRNTILL